MTAAAAVEKLAQETLNAEFAKGSILSENGKGLKPCLANAINFLRWHPAWFGVLAYDEFNCRTCALKPTPWAHTGRWSDVDDSLCADWMQRNGLMLPSKTVAEAVEVVAHENAFHPVRRYLRGLRWDGIKRLDCWLNFYLGVEQTRFAQAAGAKWAVSAVARVMNPGCKVDHCLTVEGRQGLGKSRALQILGGPWFRDNLSSMGAKDAMQELQGSWLVELAELDNRRSAQETIKAFLSRNCDNFRVPYGKRTESFPRQCVFAATHNDATPLRDETGARRFWAFRATKIRTDLLERDRDQFWAEAYLRWEAGESWWLDSGELQADAAAAADQKYECGVWDDSVLAWASDPRSKNFPEAIESAPGQVLISEILTHALNVPIERFTQPMQNSVARCLIHAGWRRKQIRCDGQRRKWFYTKGD